MVSVAICAVDFVNCFSYLVPVLYQLVIYLYLKILFNRILEMQPKRDSVSMRGGKLLLKMAKDDWRGICDQPS